MLRTSGRRIDMSQPFVDAMMPDGSRLHVVIPDMISNAFLTCADSWNTGSELRKYRWRWLIATGLKRTSCGLCADWGRTGRRRCLGAVALNRSADDMPGSRGRLPAAVLLRAVGGPTSERTWHPCGRRADRGAGTPLPGPFA